MSDTKKCKHCQSDIPKKAKVCPVCRKNQRNPLGIPLLVIGIFLFLMGCLSFDSSPSSSESNNTESSEMINSETPETTNPEYITLDEFNAIETGMSYEEVVEIIGSEGTVMSEAAVLDTTSTIYCWYADNGIANANITVSNGKVIAKAQVGLD